VPYCVVCTVLHCTGHCTAHTMVFSVANCTALHGTVPCRAPYAYACLPVMLSDTPENCSLGSAVLMRWSHSSASKQEYKQRVGQRCHLLLSHLLLYNRTGMGLLA
jgi:hypothetical protein